MPDIASFSCICKSNNWSIDWDVMYNYCAEYLRPKLFDNDYLSIPENYKLYLFLCDSWWVPDTRITRYKRLWKSFPKEWQINELSLGEEVMITSSEGVRFYGVAEVTASDFTKATYILIRRNPYFMILTQRKDINTEIELTRIFNFTYPPKNNIGNVAGESINWLNLSCNLCPLGDIIIKTGCDA